MRCKDSKKITPTTHTKSNITHFASKTFHTFNKNQIRDKKSFVGEQKIRIFALS